MIHEMPEERESKKDLLFPEESYQVMGACFAVYKAMGCGFLEAVYQECLEIELRRQRIPFASQQPLRLTYAEEPLKQTYVADIICYDRILLELKAITRLAPEHHAQVMHYLKVTGLRLGILVNFGHHPQLEHQRITSGQGRYE